MKTIESDNAPGEVKKNGGGQILPLNENFRNMLVLESCLHFCGGASCSNPSSKNFLGVNSAIFSSPSHL